MGAIIKKFPKKVKTVQNTDEQTDEWKIDFRKSDSITSSKMTWSERNKIFESPLINKSLNSPFRRRRRVPSNSLKDSPTDDPISPKKSESVNKSSTVKSLSSFFLRKKSPKTEKIESIDQKIIQELRGNLSTNYSKRISSNFNPNNRSYETFSDFSKVYSIEFKMN